MKSDGKTALDFRLQKDAIRAFMIERRGALPEDTRRIMSKEITGYVLSIPEVMNARLVDLYIPLPGYTEVDTGYLVDELTLMGKTVAVPVVEADTLFSALYRKGNPLRRAKFGQPEPEVLVKADEKTLDVVLLPLLAYDCRGYRVGYGKGFYDRFLQRLYLEAVNPLRIGLAFSMQMIDRVPTEQWDEPLDGVVHEKGFTRFR